VRGVVPTAVLCSGAALAEAMPEREGAVFVALLANHLVQGRFAAFEARGPDRAACGRGD
jgi:hypothetical protein